ncbi:hypothetical protein LB467_05775 [Salegentibacter sp. JZCK2]|uniref:hypothetical protein n=1 Tax=Salegentibacter tibetensis TaxID=2873600 RepID=UPI001CC988A0|nr:hypothetical protein [Salegentibacter tibetensis]MBZ9729188.1 hypothetical protein [Salegentibacter tibetensis]
MTRSKNFDIMFEFDQYLGFLAFLVILTMGFWLMIFLMAILPYWIGGSVVELLKEKKEARKKAKEEKA